MEKILVVEDDHTIALGLGYSLEEAGYRVEICYNTSAAMRALEAEEKPDQMCIRDRMNSPGKNEPDK